ncbi:SirB2 family protein [Isoalcanivorax beigongshangi]|uniref:SirB2 family protein n=1 Tax=Isoalcanivorax beigongshangi TaxID=3238810 RepID=A0ABV4AE66_9GAMM
MSYVALKHLHVTLAALSGLLFLVRWVWLMQGSAYLAQRWVRIAPHVIDTLLLLAGVLLMLWLRLSPLDASWFGAKLLALLVYIGAGVITLRGRRPLAGVVAVLAFAYMVGAAVRHSPWSWLA